MITVKDGLAKWQGIYKFGGVAAIGAVIVGIIESAIQFLPAAAVPAETVLDIFALFQVNPFMGLRNLGLLNIFLNLLAILTYLALYAAHKKTDQRAFATLALIISYLGIGVFFATNRTFPMLALSQEYAVATSDAQRMVLEAAGQSMISVGASHSPGTFLGFALSELAGILISMVMLRSKIFGKLTAFAGMFGFGILLVVEFFTSFRSGLSDTMLLLYMVGGLLSMAWYIMIARTLFKLGRSE